MSLNVSKREFSDCYYDVTSAHVRGIMYLCTSKATLYVSRKRDSKMNSQYVTIVQKLVIVLIAAGASDDVIELFIFYQAQFQIHKILSSLLVNVLTVNACQRREFDFVVVDTISPDEKDFSLDFFTNLTKINVALSRIKQELIIVGFKKMGKTPHSNNGVKIWDFIIQDHLRQESLTTMIVDSREIEKRFFISSEHYASARR